MPASVSREGSLSRIEVDRLSKAFDDRTVVDEISFSVPKGELCILLGPSGCGKSTTIRLIAGLEDPTSGRILIDGQDVADKSPRERRISMVFQSYALFPHLSVAENIVFGLKVRRTARAEREATLARVAEMTGLAGYLDRKPAQLSGGQRQRVALARAIAGEQPICLMDEPLSNLDAKLRGEMRLEIRALQQRLGITMVYVTHDQVEAMTMADRVILMNEGRIEQSGTPAELYERPASLFAARFIGAPAMNILQPTQGGRPVVGVRAEAVRIVATGTGRFDGTVSSVEYLGADTIVGLATPGGGVSARLPGRASHRMGDTVAAQWDAAHEHHFDPATGRRIVDGSSPGNSQQAERMSA